MNLPMNLQVGRVTPCAPQDRAWHPDGAHGVTRPTALNGFRGARREDLLRGIPFPIPAEAAKLSLGARVMGALTCGIPENIVSVCR